MKHRTRYGGRRLLALICISAVALAAVVAAPVKTELDVAFKAVATGDSFVGDATDKTYSAVIWSSEGLTEFLKKYSLPIAVERRFFDESILIVGFSGSQTAVFVDGLKHISAAQSPDLYLDLHNTGLVYKRLPPPAGQKYSCWAVVSTAKGRKISHVQVREGASGLCPQFGR